MSRPKFLSTLGLGGARGQNKPRRGNQSEQGRGFYR